MSVLPCFNPPGYVKDLNEENRKIWSEKYISQWMDDEIAGNMPGPCNTQRTPLSQFFNPTKTPYDQSQTPVPVTWNAFPKRVQLRYGSNKKLAWRMADATRLVQDEYLEWSSARNSDGNITKCTFSCEGPEYWQFLADYQNDNNGKSVFDLYKELNPDYVDSMAEEDLFLTNQKTGEKVYNPWNYWNMSTESGSIAHLVHPSNSLGAEVDLVAQATVMRMGANGLPIIERAPLIECSKYGQPLRNSDPTIGFTANSVCRGKNAISIADPVALYIHDFNLDNFKLKFSDDHFVPLSDSSLQGIVTYPRGPPPQGLRIVISIPEHIKADNGDPLTISDIYDSDDNPIEFASQFALAITMSASVISLGEIIVAADLRCPCDKSGGAPTAPDAPKSSVPEAGKLPLHIPTALLPIGTSYGRCQGKRAAGRKTVTR